MNAMTEFLPEAWRWVLEATLQACVIVAAIRILQLGLGKRLAPRWHYALWLVLLARMVMPWAPESSLSIFNLLEFARTPTVEPMPSRFAEPPVLVGTPILSTPMDELSEPSPWAAAWARVKTIGALPIIWFAGMALVLAYVALRNFMLWRAFRHAPLLTEPKALTLLDDCREQMRIRRPIPVIVAGKMFSPALFGLFRARLILPAGLVESITADQLRFVFLHELSHLKRRDLPVNWLMTLVLAVHWMNPLLWYGFYRMRLDREVACDALALSYTQDEDPHEYGLAILELVERHCRPHRIPGMVGILEDTSQLKRRIAAIAVFKKNSYRWSFLAAVVLFTLGGAVLTDALATDEAAEEPQAAEKEEVAQESADEPESPADTEEQQAAANPKDNGEPEPPAYFHNAGLPASEDPLRKLVDIDFRDMSLVTIVKMVKEMGKIDIVLPDEFTGTVTISKSQVPLGLAIEETLRVMNLRILEDEGVYRIARREAEAEAAAAASDDQGEEASDKPASQSPGYETLLFRVRHVDPESLVPHLQNLLRTVSADLRRGHIIMTGTKEQLREASKLINRLEATAEAELKRDQVRGQAEAEAEEQRKETLAAKTNPRRELSLMEQNLEIVMGVSFAEPLHLLDFVDLLAGGYDGMNFMVDSRVVRPPAATGKAAGEAGAETPDFSEYVTDGIIPHVNLQNMKFKNILKAVLKPLNLDYSVQRNFVWISTPEKIRVETFEDLEAGADRESTEAQEPEREVEDAERPLEGRVNATPNDANQVDYQETPASELPVGDDGPKDAPSSIEKALDIRIDVRFDEELHLLDFIDFIVETCDINIMVDGRVVRPPGEANASEFGLPESSEIVTDGIIAYVNLNDTRLKDILKSVLRPMKLDYSVQAGFIWITTPEKLRSETFETLETRYYVVNPEVFQALFGEGGEKVKYVTFPDPDKPDESVRHFQLVDFPFLPTIVDPITAESLSFATYNQESERLILYNSPSNLDRFEAHMAETIAKGDGDG